MFRGPTFPSKQKADQPFIDRTMVPSSSSSKSSPGVMYIAHIPPKMSASKVKSLLAPLGEVKRVYLEAEDKGVRKRRVKGE